MQEGNSGHGLRKVFLREGKKKGAHGLKKETPVLRGVGVMKGEEGSVGRGERELKKGKPVLRGMGVVK